MKVLTIKQPFATLIAEGYKTYEFRTWKSKYRGEFLIHAGKIIDKKALERCKHLNLEYPTGKIIAKVKMTNCLEVDEKLKEELMTKDKVVYYGILNENTDNKKHYAFKLEEVEKITPIECNGKLSFWEYPFN